MAGSATRVDSVSCVCRVGASIASVATNACSARPPEASACGPEPSAESSGGRVSCAKDATARPLDSHSGSTLSRSKGRLSSPKSDAIDALRKRRWPRCYASLRMMSSGLAGGARQGQRGRAECCVMNVE